MKNSKKYFILIETALAVIVVLMVFIMIRERNGRDVEKISVIIRNSDDNQWAAFKYGLKMAAQDRNMEVFVVSTGNILTAEEELTIIRDEIENGADAVIVQPVPGTDMEKMLKKLSIPVMLIEDTASEERENSLIPVTEPDNYAMGMALAEELLRDYNGNLEEKTLGIIAEAEDSEAAVNRKRGLEDALKDTGIKITWFISGPVTKDGENSLEKQPKAEIVIALDDQSLTAAGECSAQNNLHGALVYGIGNSTEAIYYLDTGIVECLVVPDQFNIGYQSFIEAADYLENYFHKMESKTVSHTVIRRRDLFTPQNQEIIFTMSQ